MDELKIIENENGNIAVQGTTLYKFLELTPNHWIKWSNKNILKNIFSTENVDYQTMKSPRGGIDYSLSLEFAKKLSMQCRTSKGEQARNYFLKCEQLAKAKETELQATLYKELQGYRRLEEIRQIKIDLNKEARNLKKEMPKPNDAQPLPKYFQMKLNFE